LKDNSKVREFHTTFRAEAFNVFNHPNPIGPNASFGQPGASAAAVFGTFTQARDPRILQFSLKLSF